MPTHTHDCPHCGARVNREPGESPADLEARAYHDHGVIHASKRTGLPVSLLLFFPSLGRPAVDGGSPAVILERLPDGGWYARRAIPS